MPSTVTDWRFVLDVTLPSTRQVGEVAADPHDPEVGKKRLLKNR